MKKLKQYALYALVVGAMVFGSFAIPSLAADHLDAPTSKTDGRIDINDVYVFHPGDPGSQNLDRTVLAMTVNPAAGAISGTAFHPKAQYDLAIDTNGDSVEDLILRTRFNKPGRNGKQKIGVYWIDLAVNSKGRQIAKGMTEKVLRGSGGVWAFVGLRDDPFFFDLASFNEGATFCEAGDSDFFLGLNGSAIVVEVPTSWIGAKPVAVWGRTYVPGMGQLDRMGRPGINTVFIPNNPFEPTGSEPSQKDPFNFGQPKDDQANFRPEIVDSLSLLFSLNDSMGDDPSDDAATVQALADILLPDVLTVDLSMETGFLNGRNLADDVIDAELGLITEGLITTDCINNDSTFLAGFPYLGAPNP